MHVTIVVSSAPAGGALAGAGKRRRPVAARRGPGLRAARRAGPVPRQVGAGGQPAAARRRPSLRLRAGDVSVGQRRYDYVVMSSRPSCPAKSSKSLTLRVARGNWRARQHAAIQLSLAGRGRPRRRAAAEILPHDREVASSEFSTTTRPSHCCSSSPVRGVVLLLGGTARVPGPVTGASDQPALLVGHRFRDFAESEAPSSSDNGERVASWIPTRGPSAGSFASSSSARLRLRIP
jgi:hypothetical protein